MRAWGKQLPNTAMQQDRSAAVLATRSQRLSQLARRSALFFKKIPLAVWRLLVALLLVLWLAHSLARLFWLVVPEPNVPEAQLAANALMRSEDRRVGKGCESFVCQRDEESK